MSLVATKLQNSKSSDNNTNSNTANLNSNANETRVFCKDCGFKHWSNNKWCEQCKQHEEDKWVWCSTCNKHHGKEWRRCKAKANSSSDTTPSNTPSNTPNASAGALNTTTGLPVGLTRLSQMAIKAELFEKRYIDRGFFSTLPALIISLTANGGLLNMKTSIPYQLEQAMVEQELQGTVRVPLLLHQANTPGLDTIIQGLPPPNKKLTSIPSHSATIVRRNGSRHTTRPLLTPYGRLRQLGRPRKVRSLNQTR